MPVESGLQSALQPLVSSLSVKYSMPVESGLQSALNRHTARLFTESDDTRGCKADCSPLSIGILYDCLQRVTIPEAVKRTAVRS